MQNHHATNPPVPAVFCFESHEVRTFGKDDEFWFSAKDVADVLGYANTMQAIRIHCKRVKSLKQLEYSCSEDDAMHINSAMIQEGDVYRLIVRSKKPIADKFETWLMEEVLPSIRKTGSYGVTVAPTLPTNPVDYLLMVADAIRDQQSRTAQVESLALETAVSLDELKATTRLHDWQRFELKEAVDHKVADFKAVTTKSTPTLYRTMWGFLKKHFRVSTYTAIPATRFGEAKIIVDNCTFQQIGGAA